MNHSLSFGYDDLVIACDESDLGSVNDLIDGGIEVNAASDDGMSVLSYASQQGQHAVVKSLITRGADVKSVDRHKRTALMVACAQGHVETIQILLEGGSDVESRDKSSGWTALIWAINGSHLKAVKLLLDHNANPCHLDLSNGWTPLMYACLNGDIDIIQLLIDTPALEIINMLDKCQQWNALMCATQACHVSVVRLLLSHGASVTVARGDNTTCLMIACQGGNEELVSIFIDAGVNLDQSDKTEGMTALMHACERGYVNLVKILVDKGANVTSLNKRKKTAIQIAQKQGFSDIVTLLEDVIAKKTKPTKDKEKRSPKSPSAISKPTTPSAVDGGSDARTNFLLSCSKGDKNSIIMYLDRGVDVDYVGPNDETALSLASKEGQSETVTLLLSKGCKVDSKAGRMALLSACQNGFTDIVEVLLKHQDGLILSANLGALALMQASAAGHSDTIACLLNHKVGIHSLDSDGKTALIRASEKGFSDAVTTLLDHGAFIDASTPNGWTSLSRASYEGFTDTVRLLLERNADMFSIDETYQKTLIMAEIQRDISLYIMGQNIPPAIGSNANDEFEYLIHIYDSIVKDQFKKALANPSQSNKQRPEPTEYQECRTKLDRKSAFLVALHFYKQKQFSFFGLEINSKFVETFAEFLLEGMQRNDPDSKERLEHIFRQEIRKTNRNNWFGLLWACERGHADILRLFIDRLQVMNQISQINERTNDGWTPLMRATVRGYRDVVQILLDAGADAETRDRDGKSVLLWAMIKNEPIIAEALIRNGANVDVVNKEDQRSPIMWAAYEGHGELVRLILSKNAQIDAVDRIYSRNALRWAYHGGHLHVMKALFEVGANANSSRAEGKTILLCACQAGEKDIVKLLLENKADVELNDKYSGWTPLMWACEKGYLDIVKLLLLHNANVNARLVNGRTALMLASHLKIVENLVANGADPNAKDDNHGWNSLTWAQNNNRTDVVEFLEGKTASLSSLRYDGDDADLLEAKTESAPRRSSKTWKIFDKFRSKKSSK